MSEHTMQNDIAYFLIFPTRFGHAAVIFSQNPFMINKTLLPLPDRENLVKVLEAKGCGASESHDKAVIVKDVIIDYFRGKSVQPIWDWMDLSGLTRLQKSVLSATADIPYGELKSYREIAMAIDHPRAYRFVGNTLAKNPFPILIPCHRVIRSDASFGQFGGGTELKRKMIEMEAGYH